jgi:uncharacterized membrane protein
VRHDGLIVGNELRAALSSWSDRLIALVIIVIALAAARSSLSHRPFIFAATAIAALSAVAGAGASRMIPRRLAYHSEEGVIAADALADRPRRHYIMAVHAIICGAVTFFALIVRPGTAVLALIAYLAGAGIPHILCRFTLKGSARRRLSLLRSVKPLLQQPISGACAAIPLVVLLLLFKSIDPVPLAVLIGLISAVAALLLTMADYSVIRFMSSSGYRAGRIIDHHARSLLIFLVLTVAASLALSDRLIVIVLCGVVLTTLVLLTARILAYRVHSKRTADALLSVCVAVACLAGLAIPVLLPLVVLAVLWRLHRRSVSATWLMT